MSATGSASHSMSRKRSAPLSDQDTRSPRNRRDNDDDEIPWWEQERSRASMAPGTSASGRERERDWDQRSPHGRNRDWDNSRRDRGGGGGGGYRGRERDSYNPRQPRTTERYSNRERSPSSIQLNYGAPPLPPPTAPRGGGPAGRGRGSGDSAGYRQRNDYRAGDDGRRGYGREEYSSTTTTAEQRGALPTPLNGQSETRADLLDRRRDDVSQPLNRGYNEVPSHQESIPPASSVPPAPSDDTGKEEGEEEEIDLVLEEDKEPDMEAFLEERRRKREEILKKYQKAEVEAEVEKAVEVKDDKKEEVEEGAKMEIEPKPETVAAASNGEREGTDTPEPPSGPVDFDLDLIKDSSADNSGSPYPPTSNTGTLKAEEEDEVNAADYNPDEDRKRDDQRRVERGEVVEVVEAPKVETIVVGEEEEDEDEEEVDDDDDDEDDMFSIGVPKATKGKKTKRTKTMPVQIDRALDPSSLGGITDNFDDAEGYYKLVLGEVLDGGRYHVHAHLGKGIFSSVVRARDTQSVGGKEEVAIKVIRSQESMYKAGLKEAGILRKLQQEDPLDKKHVIRLQRTFEHRGHLCLVFESLSMNLREVVKRFGKDVGINLRAVRAYASQMFLALSLLKKCNIMHADIKPDNILVSESKSVLKICDLGSASDVSENDITPYLASRFYRAPEIRLPYDCALDTWAIGCTLYELYTGKILFPGRTNNHMLYLIMELKGKFMHKTIKKARFADQHFDENVNFISIEKNGTPRIVAIPNKAQHDLRSRLMPAAAMKKLKEDELKLLTQFVDLLDKMLALDPAKRPSPKELLNHPFLRS